MIDDGGIDPNEGQDPGATTPDPGSGDQNGQQTDPGQADALAQRDAEIRRLNKALAQKSRSTSSTPDGSGVDEGAFDTPEGQYAIALQVATGHLRDKLESVFDLYPELDAKDLNKIRKNPWAFTNLQNYQTGDWEAAAQDIEWQLLDMVNEKGGQQTTPQEPNQPSGGTQQPAQVNNNPADQGEQTTTEEPTKDDLFAMPLDELEQRKNKELKRLKSQA